MNQINKLLGFLLEKYSTGEYLEKILKGKDEYFLKAGEFSQEDEDFENRMNGFNYWYLFERKDSAGKTLFNKFKDFENISEEEMECLKEINYSLFEYNGSLLTKKHVLKDILHKNKIYIAKDKLNLSFVKNDIFIARMVKFKNEYFLLHDVSILPQETRSILMKECNKLRKLNNRDKNIDFLITLEKLKTKYRYYPHLKAQNIFNFSS